MAKTAAETIYVLNGPNLNLLGTREPETYGHANLADVEKLCAETAEQFGLKADCRQSNREGELIDFIHEAHARKAAGIIINAGGYSHTSIDDGGQPINPLILHGQVHGGVAQGMGQAMMEAAVYEPGSGQLLSASFLDYGMPRADHFPHMDVELTEDPTAGNVLRVKGGGEAGITPSSAVLMNAVMDALSGFGIDGYRLAINGLAARIGVKAKA